MLQLELPKEIAFAALCGAVGEGAATEWMAFERMYDSLPNIDGAIHDPDNAIIPTEPGALYATATALGYRANPNNFGRIGRYAQRLADANKAEYAVLMIRDAERRDPSIMHTPEYTQLVCGPIGRLMSGEVN